MEELFCAHLAYMDLHLDCMKTVIKIFQAEAELEVNMKIIFCQIALIEKMQIHI